MAAPSVAIVGRPNVGKSALFNALCGERVSIVDSEAGVTRDRVSRTLRHKGRRFTLVDTGGMGIESAEEIQRDIERQIEMALTEAALLVLVVDATAGVHPLDKSISRRLRKARKPILLVANKCDSARQEAEAADFFELGLGEPLPVSALHRRKVSVLKEQITAVLPEADEQEKGDAPMKLALVGRRNVGKSTLLNLLADEPRVIVSEMPGTTRDAVDVNFRLGEIEFTAIDTAGVRKRRQLKDSVDFYSFARTKRSIRRADVVVLLLEAPSEVSRVDRQLGDYVASQYKPCVLAVNKFDLTEGVDPLEFEEYVRASLPMLRYAPVVCMSALAGTNTFALLETACVLHDQNRIWVAQGELTRVMEEITDRVHPPSRTRRPARVYDAKQTGVQPLTFVLLTNRWADIDDNYRRYLANQLRRAFAFKGVPVRIIARKVTRSRSGR